MARASVVSICRRQAGPQAARIDDPVFLGLDGRPIRGGRIRVTGIHRLRDNVFVQITSTAERGCGFVLRMSTYATAGQALAAIDARMALPADERPHVEDVMRVANIEDRRPLPAC
jgi:hypothetical protein